MLELLLTFVYTGFVAFGGGLATIPVLYQSIVEKGLLAEEIFYNMVAISQATPGPVGLNLATYVGYSQEGIIGALLASFAISLSSLICVSIFARMYDKIKNNKMVLKAMNGIKAAITGVIVVAVIKVLKLVMINLPEAFEFTDVDSYIEAFKFLNYPSIITIIVLFLLIKKYKGSPIKYIALGGIVGIFLF